MFRITIVELLLFGLPFFVFAVYLVVARKMRDTQAIQAAMPVAKLAVAGLLIAIIGFFVLVKFQRAGPEGKYHPATFEDGKIKPGRIE